MEFTEAKEQFLKTWGELGANWGINKTMAQIHALLMVAPDSLSMEEVMEELHISRGSASMNLRALIEWELIFKEYKYGERREYFKAEQDIVQLARKVAIERRKRELKPTLEVLENVQSFNADSSKEERHFKAKTKELYDIVSKADTMLEKIVNQKENWITKTIFKLMT
ncbi:MAG: transcriptional regulator [Leeuwenhoekiella sp.]